MQLYGLGGCVWFSALLHRIIYANPAFPRIQTMTLSKLFYDTFISAAIGAVSLWFFCWRELWSLVPSYEGIRWT
jgi:hypothetical protein